MVVLCEAFMRFVEPFYALLFLPLAVGLWFSWSKVLGMAKARKAVAFGLRGLLASCLIIALMGPQASRPNSGLAVMFLLDRSDSISDSDRDAAHQFVKSAVGKLNLEDVAGVISFGRQPVIESAPASRRELPKPSAKLDGSASDLASAMRLAGASFPEGKTRRIVLLSDGNETLGDALQAAESAGIDDVEIDVVPLGTKPRRAEAAILELTAPTERRSDEPFDLHAVIETSTAQDATIVLDRDGVVQARKRVALQPGKNSVVLGQVLKQPGFYRYKATLEPDFDTDNRNNIGSAFVSVKGKPRILVLQGSKAQTELATALRGQGIDVDLYGPEGIPTRPEDVQVYDAVILNDINASYFQPEQMQILKQATQDAGIGLAMIGGEDSFLPGGWYGTAVAEALPVDLNVRQRKSFPSTSVLIMIDASGSMGMVEGGQPKIRLAAKAAEMTANLLSPQDRLGVAGSTDGIEFVAPMQQLQNKNAVISGIRKLSVGGGGIYAKPTIDRAEKELTKENSKVKHFILLADGNDVDDYGDSLQTIRRMRANKITTSVVAIGSGKDVPFLRQLAAAGGGNYYLAESASKLPAIFTQDVSLISRSAIEEGVFTPKMTIGEEILRGIDATPPLFAYCLSDARPLARVGMRTHKDDPLLAVWQFGLGSSLAFTSDAKSQWARQWVGWEGFARFWAQAVRSIMRRGTTNKYSVEAVQAGGRGVLKLDAKDAAGSPLTDQGAKVLVSKPDGTSEVINLIQEAPGSYSGSFDARLMGSYIISVAEESAGGKASVTSTGFSVPYPPEYRSYRPNTSLLQNVSQTARGKTIKEPAEALRPLNKPGGAIQDLWFFFVLGALIILPIDVAIRRIAIPIAEMLANLKNRKKAATAVEEARFDRLRSAKKSSAAPTATADPTTVTEAPKKKREIENPGGSAATSLLEAKRRRQNRDE